MLQSRVRNSWRITLLLILLASLGGAALRGQPAHPVRNINTTPWAGLQELVSYELTALGNFLFFIVDDGSHGVELWVSDGTEEGTRLFVDVCPGFCSGSPKFLTPSNGLLFFVADDGDEDELWVADPAAGTARMVKDVNPGFFNSYDSVIAGGLFDVDGTLFFIANDGVHGQELWRTDGTAAGTRLVKDIRPGPEGSEPVPMAASGGLLLLSANDGSHGQEPWISDGTEEGTILLADIFPDMNYGLRYQTARDAVATPGGKFLFRAHTEYAGEELWVSDGTPAGTSLLKDIHSGSSSSEPSQLTVVGDNVFFTASLPGYETWAKELWVTDGTAAGTVLVKDIRPGAEGSFPQELTAVGGRLFFQAYDDIHGNEIWTSDGTPAGTFLVKDIRPGQASALLGYGFPFGLTDFGGELLFFAEDESGWRNLWRSDGTEAGTVQVTAPSDPPYFPTSTSLLDSFALAGGRLFYLNRTSSRFTLLATDGTQAGTAPLKTLVTPERGSIGSTTSWNGPVEHGGLLLFPASDGLTGVELWRSDGTAEGTFLVRDLVPGTGSGYLFDMTPFNGSIFFSAGYPGALWKTDGTPDGTEIVSQDVFDPYWLTPFNGSLFFSADSGEAARELFKTDGTGAGTVLVKDILPGGDDGDYHNGDAHSGMPGELTVSGGKLFFSAVSELTDFVLWKTDGTEAGTVRVGINQPGVDPWLVRPFNLIDNGGSLFFFADSGLELGAEPWTSDGTDAGTVLLKDVSPGQTGSDNPLGPPPVALPGGVVLFVAKDSAKGAELWKSDGTEAGTVLVKDIRPGPASSWPHSLTLAGGRVYFSANDGDHGRELWVSDGTEAGTWLVEDIFPGLASSLPGQLYAQLYAAGPILAFTASDGIHGAELWRSDGTALGTRMFQDIAPGTPSANPRMFQIAGPNFYFGADDGVTGSELWAMPRTALLATFADVPADHWAWRFVEALVDSGLTGGCGGDGYCPGASLTRAQAAVFLGRAIHGTGFVPPPATGSIFTDVPASHWAAGWIEQIAADGLTGGCNDDPPQYCPNQQLTRAAMAVLLLRAKHGSAYTPPPATGTVFTDVPAGFWAAPWIEQLAAEGITTGCGGGAYCPGNPVNRAEMAAFLVRTFNLPLP
jgi:ELWxxDGT repeat protein